MNICERQDIVLTDGQDSLLAKLEILLCRAQRRLDLKLQII